MNNRVGCAFDFRYRAQYEQEVGKYYGSPLTAWGLYRRMENGMNFALSAFGSLLYLIGSVMFIPSTGAIVDGTVVFIVGSLVIFLSQMWKVYRQGLTDPNDIALRVFKLSNYQYDLPALGVDAFAGIGGLAYAVGSAYFLPQYDTSDAVTILAATWFTFGGSAFTLSGLFIVYRYYFTLNYVH